MMLLRSSFMRIGLYFGAAPSKAPKLSLEFSRSRHAVGQRRRRRCHARAALSLLLRWYHLPLRHTLSYRLRTIITRVESLAKKPEEARAIGAGLMTRQELIQYCSPTTSAVAAPVTATRQLDVCHGRLPRPATFSSRNGGRQSNTFTARPMPYTPRHFTF